MDSKQFDEVRKSAAQTLNAISNGYVPDEQLPDPRPEEVQEIAKLCSRFSDMHRAVGEAHFPAKASVVVGHLMDHLKAQYDKHYNELVSHPWVKEQQEIVQSENTEAKA